MLGGSSNRGFWRGHSSRGSRGLGFFQHQGPPNYSQPSYATPDSQSAYGLQNYVMPSGQPTYVPPPPNMEMGQNTGQAWIENCGKCGRNQHQHPNVCPAVNKFCRGCSRKGHFLRVCRTTARMQAMQQSQ